MAPAFQDILDLWRATKPTPSNAIVATATLENDRKRRELDERNLTKEIARAPEYRQHEQQRPFRSMSYKEWKSIGSSSARS